MYCDKVKSKYLYVNCNLRHKYYVFCKVCSYYFAFYVLLLMLYLIITSNFHNVVCNRNISTNNDEKNVNTIQYNVTIMWKAFHVTGVPSFTNYEYLLSFIFIHGYYTLFIFAYFIMQYHSRTELCIITRRFHVNVIDIFSVKLNFRILWFKIL